MSMGHAKLRGGRTKLVLVSSSANFPTLLSFSLAHTSTSTVRVPYPPTGVSKVSERPSPRVGQRFQLRVKAEGAAQQCLIAFAAPAWPGRTVSTLDYIHPLFHGLSITPLLLCTVHTCLVTATGTASAARKDSRPPVRLDTMLQILTHQLADVRVLVAPPLEASLTALWMAGLVY